MTNTATPPFIGTESTDAIAGLAGMFPEVDFAALLAVEANEYVTPEEAAYVLIAAGCDADLVRRVLLDDVA